jgi:hypothetical protein
MALGEIFTDLPSLLGGEAKKAAGRKSLEIMEASLATPVEASFRSMNLLIVSPLSE